MNRRLSSSFFVAAICFVVGSTATFAATCPANVGATATPTSDFVVNANGTVAHTPTGLMWKQCNEGKSGAACETGAASTMTWANALTTARTGNFAGYADWRLPNKQELESLVDDRCHLPAINDTVFPGTVADWTWTSTTLAADPAVARVVDFARGDGYALDKPYDFFVVRLVRGGQSFDALTAAACGGLMPLVLTGSKFCCPFRAGGGGRVDCCFVG